MLVAQDRQAIMECNMPASVPAIVQATPAKKTLTMRMVDADGGLKAVSFPILNGATDAEINAFVNAYGAVSNADIYQVIVGLDFGADFGLPSNAIDAPRVSVQDVVNVLYKPTTNPLLAPIRLELLAPETALLDGLIVNQPATLLLRNAFEPLINFSGAGFEVSAYTFTERKKKNARTRPL